MSTTVLYAQPSDISRFCTSAKSITGVALDVQMAALEAASREFDNHIVSIFGEESLPLTDWDDSVREKVCMIACYRIFKVRGFDPGKGTDVLIVKDKDEAVLWMLRVSRQEIRPRMVGQPKAPKPVNQPVVKSRTPRGFF